MLKLVRFQTREVDLLKNGVRLHATHGQTIEALVSAGATERFSLAQQRLVVAQKLRRTKPPAYRDSISRAYYSMYHAARAVSYFVHQGDDFQKHNELHKGIPDGFPDAAYWRNALKAARLRRNDADYDPYPLADQEFAALCRQQAEVVEEFLTVASDFLRGLGCRI